MEGVRKRVSREVKFLMAGVDCDCEWPVLGLDRLDK